MMKWLANFFNKKRSLSESEQLRVIEQNRNPLQDSPLRQTEAKLQKIFETQTPEIHGTTEFNYQPFQEPGCASIIIRCMLSDGTGFPTYELFIDNKRIYETTQEFLEGWWYNVSRAMNKKKLEEKKRRTNQVIGKKLAELGLSDSENI